MLDTALVLSLVQLAGVTVAARFPHSRGAVVTLALLPGGLLCLGLVLWPVLFGGLLVAVAAAVWPPRPGTRAAFHLASACAVVGGYLLTAPLVWAAEREYARLRAVYPFEPVADRLPPRPPGVPPAFDEAAVADAESEYLWRGRRRGPYFTPARAEQLRQLHEEQTELFVNSVGFGVGRLGGFNPTAASLGEPRLLDRESDPTLDRMVRDDALDFAGPARWGYRRGEQVAGFLPHALRRHPGPANGWAVERVELVGLLLAPDPRVYVADHLPRMDELAAVATRHPDGFESPALAKLRAGDELVHDAPVGRLLGAIRAAKQCLACHGGHRGDLLGAFSYRLRQP